MNKISTAIVGATGAVGMELLSILEERQFPISKLKLLASPRSAKKKILFNSVEHEIEPLTEKSFEGFELVFFVATEDVSRNFVPIAVKSSALVIDNSSAFRLEDDVPLVVPEVNSHCLPKKAAAMIISNPNCSTIQMVVALNPLHKEASLKRVVVSTYQSVSGAGRRAMEELKSETHAHINGEAISAQADKVFPHRISFNYIPQIGRIEPDGITKEERKLIRESAKILSIPDLKVSATAVRVPVFRGHGESVLAEFENPISVKRAREILSVSQGIKIFDDDQKYPTASDADGGDDVWVGRIRKDVSVKNGLGLWIVADNLRKGAALNAVQIAEHIYSR